MIRKVPAMVAAFIYGTDITGSQIHHASGRNLVMLKARDVAEWFVAWAEDEEDTELTQLKLQKLLYYAKGLYMQETGGGVLFPERLQAWSHGPVVPEVYYELKRYGRGPIDADEFVSPGFDWDDFKQVEDTLLEVWRVYGPYSAWALRNKTHEESPWKKNFVPDEKNISISDNDMREFFLTNG